MVAMFGSSVLLFSLCTSVYGKQIYDFKSSWFQGKAYAPRQAPLAVLILQPLRHPSINMDPQELRAAMLYGWQKFKNLHINRTNYDVNPKYFYLEDSRDEPTTLEAILRRSRDRDKEVEMNTYLPGGGHFEFYARWLSEIDHNLFAMVFETIMPMPTTMPKLKNFAPSARFI